MSKQALISPNELRESGYRVAQVESDNAIFDVASPLFWTPCADNVIPDQYWYNPQTKTIEEVPPYIPTAEDNTQTAIKLLQDTDWATIPDVSNPNLSNPYLSNVNEFIDYRNKIRLYTINPIGGNIDWYIKPEPIWITK